MRARSTRPVASVRERAILANAQHWSGSIESVMTRRAATSLPPAMPARCLPYLAYIAYNPTTYRQFGIFVLAIGTPARGVRTCLPESRRRSEPAEGTPRREVARRRDRHSK